MANNEVSSSSDVKFAFWRIKRPCPVCRKAISNSNIHRHVRDIHQADLNDYHSTPKKQDKKPKENENCNNLIQHLKVTDQLDTKQIQKCNSHQHVPAVAQVNPEVYKNHNKHASSPFINARNGKKPFKCGKCQQSFRLISELKLHKISIHQKSQVFKCKDCTKVFISKSGLMEHERVHTNEKPFYCHYCPQRFRTRGLWHNHQMDHTGKRPFNCTFCSKGFKLKFQLQMHLTKCKKREIGNEKDTSHTTGLRKRQGPSIRVKQERSNNSLKELKDKTRRGRLSDEEHLAEWRLIGLVPVNDCCIVVKRHKLIEEAVEKGLRSIKVDQTN